MTQGRWPSIQDSSVGKALIILGLLAVAAGPSAVSAAYLDTPAPVHAGGIGTTLIDLTPPGPLLTPGILSPTPGRVSLLPGFGGGVFFRPGAPAGSICFGGSNPAIAGVSCLFTDGTASPGVGWHGEFAIHNASGLVTAFNAAFFDGWGNVYAGPAVLGVDSTLYVDLHLADGAAPHFSEGGLALVWAASTVPRLLDISFTVEESVTAGGDGILPCPLRVASIQGLTPQGAFGCTFRFFSAPEDSWIAGADDPTLPRFGLMDPADLEANRDIFPSLPQPATLWLVALAPLAYFARARLRSPWGRGAPRA